MKNVNCGCEPPAAAVRTSNDNTRPSCVDGIVVTSCRRKNVSVSTVWLSIQRMVAVHHDGHLSEPERPASTSASLLAARLQLQCLSMPSYSRQLDTGVDDEVSRLLCRPPSGRRRRNHRVAGLAKQRFASISDHMVSASWAEPGAGRDSTSQCRLRRKKGEDFKRPCLDFYKMQARQSSTLCRVPERSTLP